MEGGRHMEILGYFMRLIVALLLCVALSFVCTIPHELAHFAVFLLSRQRAVLYLWRPHPPIAPDTGPALRAGVRVWLGGAVVLPDSAWDRWRRTLPRRFAVELAVGPVAGGIAGIVGAGLIAHAFGFVGLWSGVLGVTAALFCVTDILPQIVSGDRPTDGWWLAQLMGDAGMSLPAAGYLLFGSYLLFSVGAFAALALLLR